MTPPFYAHTLPDRPETAWEPLEDHLHAVADAAAERGCALGLDPWAYLAGSLHDLGKTSEAFQRRLRGGPKVDHATAGAVEATRRWGTLGRVLSYAVAGHHAGLPDSGELQERLAKADTLPSWCPDFIALPEKLPPLNRYPADQQIAPSLLIRMIFSCLVDADFVATEGFMNPDASARRGRNMDINPLIERLEAYLARLGARASDSPLNADRRAIQDACRAAGAQPQGIFSLTVPTGGGKTLASLLFALHHARTHGLRRVIVAIPYTSIIEQTAATFREVLGDDAVLEHHCNYPVPDDEDDEGVAAYEKLRLDTENWDAPVIVTTNVQLFESLFANRPSRCRKLHHLAGSVVVLDEAQMLPVDYLKPCMAVIRELAGNYRVSPVLCTATQPALEQSDWLPDGFADVREIAPSPADLHETFRRVTVQDDGALDDDTLAGELAAREQVLCIVNTRDHAANLFAKLRARADSGVYHLSARMCAAHRTARLADIRQALKDGHPCRVVSTQLVEAGVDVDFPEVFRAQAGLDSLAQAAGRCNREKRHAQGTLHVFQAEKDIPVADWQRRIACGRAVMDRGEDPLSPGAQRAFFQRLYDLERGNLDKKGILPMLSEGAGQLSFQFREAAAAFRFIDSPMEPVIVPYDETAKARIADLHNSDTPGRAARKLDLYTVQIHPRDIANLKASGAVALVRDVYWVLVNEDVYNDDLGLCPDDPTYRSVEGSFV